MFRISKWLSFVSLLLLLSEPPGSLAQFSGSRGGNDPYSQSLHTNTAGPAGLTTEQVQGYITVEGKAELRVPPTQIRIVIAITAAGESPQACQMEVDQKISALKTGWQGQGIKERDIVDDFIAVLPRYSFDVEEKSGQRMAVERKSGYLMQSNLHIAVKNDEQAMAAIKVAFANEVSDIIAFDYWNDQIEELKKEALAKAIEAAKDKSKTLLAVFDKQPPLINLAESTYAVYPESVYESFGNSNGDEFYSTGSQWRDIAVLRSFRPKNTYYRGFYSNADVQPTTLPMKSEISIVSTVKLYYESPVAKDYQQLKRE